MGGRAMNKRMVRIGVTGFLMLTFFFLTGLQGWAAGGDRYPEKPITYIIPMEPGSSMDNMGRPLAELWQKELRQPIMIVNKPGGAGTIGLRAIYNSKPDGYTVGQANTINYAKFMGLIPFDHHDMDIIGLTSLATPGVFINTDRPWKSIRELVEFAKNHPGEIKLATASKGGLWWLAAKGFENAAMIKLNVLPQPGGGAMAVVQLAGGHVDIAVCGTAEAASQLRAGKIRLLATFGHKRLQGYEKVPTLIESGFNTDVVGTNCVVAPKGLPKPVFDILLRTFETVVKKPEFHKTLIELGAYSPEIVGAEAVKFLDDQANVLKPLLKNP
jgi:tripartite-type tricarboxylate transporter receptor subunit TctC